MLVYRIEDRYKRGAYNAKIGDDRRMAHACFDNTNHPPPSKDGMSFSRLYDHHHFGFASPRDLVRWFPRAARNGLAAYNTGCGIGVYEVHGNAVLRGNKQIAFNRKKAKRVAFRKFARTDLTPQLINVTVQANTADKCLLF